MTPELWALEGVIALGAILIAYALWPERQPRAKPHPEHRAQHGAPASLLGGETVRLHEQWPVAAAYVRPVVRCECPVLIERGRIAVPLTHYAGCPRAAN